MKGERWVGRLVAASAMAAVAAAGTHGCGGSSSNNGGDAGNGGYASLCPVFGNQPTCPLASDADGCNLSLGDDCAADALPQGLSCSGTSQCQARVGPVDGCGRVDGWICSCVDGSWSCDDCAVGAAVCEGGTAEYELPEMTSNGPGATACEGAGGQCLLPPSAGCAHVSSLTCEPNNPGGLFCCLDHQ
jgi:hypothetical protein